jgi:tRNA (guanine-N7-)-methyltransferase
MKPKDLKPPFTWKDRRVVLANRVLYVPDHYDHYQEFQFPGWSDPALFGNERPVRIEFCSGNGDWVAHRALSDRASNWVAIEKMFDRSRKIWSKTKNAALDNLFIICGEALNATSLYIPSLSVEEVFVNFPDPWPKKRHAKHRLINESFLEQLQRILKPSGLATLVTDDVDYCQQMIHQFIECPSFQPVHPAPFYTTHCSDYGTSYFEQLWRRKGKLIHYLQFVKK